MNGRAPAPTDSEGALSFEERPARPSNGAIIHLAYQGVPVDLKVNDKKIGDIEQLINGLIKRGWSAPPVARGGFGGQRPDRIKPETNDKGELCCTVHHRPLQWREWEGRKFLSCPAKGDESKGEKVNKNGYCALKFQEG